MTTNAPPDNKPSGTMEAETAREAMLSWAEQQSRIRARALLVAPRVDRTPVGGSSVPTVHNATDGDQS